MAENTPAYFTVSGPGEAEIEIKRSSFIGYVYPVTTEKEVTSLLQQVKAEHPRARHHVYAWRLGSPGRHQQQRYSDDGEPQGTAGIPVLDVLLHQELTDVLVVVVRYFGGILLGTGGLVRAYSASAVEAVKAAVPIMMKPQLIYSLSLPYSSYNSFDHKASRMGVSELTVDYAANISLTVGLDRSTLPSFLSLVADLTGGQVEPAFIKEDFVPCALDGANGEEQTETEEEHATNKNDQ